MSIFDKVDLTKLYATSRALKDEVYAGWIQNLDMLSLRGIPEMTEEAGRRIDYIRQNLLKGRVVCIKSGEAI